MASSGDIARKINDGPSQSVYSLLEFADGWSSVCVRAFVRVETAGRVNVLGDGSVSVEIFGVPRNSQKGVGRRLCLGDRSNQRLVPCFIIFLLSI